MTPAFEDGGRRINARGLEPCRVSVHLHPLGMAFGNTSLMSGIRLFIYQVHHCTYDGCDGLSDCTHG